MEEGYVILDLETTGLSKYYHKITEIAAMKVKNNEIVEKFETLVNPQVPIPKFITRLTGITNEMVENEPTINEVMPKFIEFLGDHPIVAHNATFDHGFLTENAIKCGLEMNNKKICTKKLANRLLPESPSKRLTDLCSHFNIINDQAHRAMSDVKATYQLLNEFKNMMEEMGIKTSDDVIKFQDSKINRN
ncbi:3'-5' exonuclease [Candidatus Woesearchaeota archaeon]|nr:3'-5' exonuclease [Candidatus Woesearchaeota archaeon]